MMDTRTVNKGSTKNKGDWYNLARFKNEICMKHEM
jgi:hypothetical protein